MDLAEVGPAVAEHGPQVLRGSHRFDPFGVWGDLRREGIVIFGNYRSHRHAVRPPGLAAPTQESGEWISARLTRQ